MNRDYVKGDILTSDGPPCPLTPARNVIKGMFLTSTPVVRKSAPALPGLTELHGRIEAPLRRVRS